ncbi:MAG TPA: aldo/keto reductase [Chloroflexota bacterium]|nr:aldo/keto reductase [Chloroflexota bacterium]
MKKLGRTGLKVSEICLGCMTFGNQADEATSAAIVRRAVDAGVNFLDTANSYNGGLSEEYTGKALKGIRDDVVLATKVYNVTGSGPNDRGLSRRHIMRAVEDSLRRLQTDNLDLYQVHRFDVETPLEETLRVLDDLVHQGKVRYLGCSNYAAWQLGKALRTSERHNLFRYECIQPRFNLISRSIEAELLPLCLDEGVGVIVYNPLAAGLLTGKHHRESGPVEGSRFDTNAMYRDRYWSDRSFDAVDRLREIAESTGHSMAKLSIAWVLANPAITAAILGASRPDQLDETLAATQITLSTEHMAQLDELWSIVGRYETPRQA